MRLHKEQPLAGRSRTAGPFFKSLSGVLSTYMFDSHISNHLTCRLHNSVTSGALEELEAAPAASRQRSCTSSSIKSLQAAAVIETDAWLPYQRSVRAGEYTLDYLEEMNADSTATPSTASIDSSPSSTPATSISGSSMSSPSKRSDDRARSNSAPQPRAQLAEVHETTLNSLTNVRPDTSSAQAAVDVENNTQPSRRMYTDRASKCPVPPIPQEYLSEANQHINNTLPFRPPVIQQRVSSARGQTKSKFRTSRLKSLSRRSTEDCAVTPRTERMNAFIGESVSTAKISLPMPAQTPGHVLTLPETGFLGRLQQAPTQSQPHLPEPEEAYEPEYVKAREHCAPPPPSFTSLNYGQTRIIHPRPATSPRVHSFVAKSWRSRSLPRLVPAPSNEQWTIDSSTFKSNRDDEPRFASLGAFLDGYDEEHRSEQPSSPDLLVSDEVLGKSDTALDGMIRDLAVDIGEPVDAEPPSQFIHSAYTVDGGHGEKSAYDFDDSVFQARIFYNGRLRRPGSIYKPK